MKLCSFSTSVALLFGCQGEGERMESLQGPSPTSGIVECSTDELEIEFDAMNPHAAELLVTRLQTIGDGFNQMEVRSSERYAATQIEEMDRTSPLRHSCTLENGDRIEIWDHYLNVGSRTFFLEPADFIRAFEGADAIALYRSLNVEASNDDVKNFFTLDGQFIISCRTLESNAACSIRSKNETIISRFGERHWEFYIVGDRESQVSNGEHLFNVIASNEERDSQNLLGSATIGTPNFGIQCRRGVTDTHCTIARKIDD